MLSHLKRLFPTREDFKKIRFEVWKTALFWGVPLLLPILGLSIRKTREWILCDLWTWIASEHSVLGSTILVLSIFATIGLLSIGRYIHARRMRDDTTGLEKIDIQILKIAYENYGKNQYQEHQFVTKLEAPKPDIALSLRKLQKLDYLYKSDSPQLLREGQLNPNGYVLCEKGIALIKKYMSSNR